MGSLDSPPTRVRFGVLAFLCSLTFVLYLDRICIGQAQPDVMRDLGLSKTQMGHVNSAFQIAYGLFELPMGRWGDRFGSRGVLTRIVLWWSAFTALTGAAWGFLPLLLVRFLFGAGEAGALPNAARVVAQWFSVGARGRAQGMITTSMLLGGVVAPMAAEFLIRTVGWRYAFGVFGCIGVVWAVAFYTWFRDNPAQHPRVNAAELEAIRDGQPAPSHAEAHPPVPWHLVLPSLNVWMMILVLNCGTFVSYLYYSWYPTYLVQGRGVDKELASRLTSLVLAGGASGCILGGFLGDWLRRTFTNRRAIRSLTGAGGFGCAAVALSVGMVCESPVASAWLTAVAFFSSMVQLATWWIVASEISGRHVGAMFGLMNMFAQLGGVASHQFIGRVVDWQEQHGYSGRAAWDPALFVYVGVLALGCVGWLLIDASKSVVEPTPETAPA